MLLGVAFISLTLSTDGHQLDTLATDKIQGLVHVGNLVEAHFAFVGLGEPFTCQSTQTHTLTQST